MTQRRRENLELIMRIVCIIIAVAYLVLSFPEIYRHGSDRVLFYADIAVASSLIFLIVSSVGCKNRSVLQLIGSILLTIPFAYLAFDALGGIVNEGVNLESLFTSFTFYIFALLFMMPISLAMFSLRRLIVGSMDDCKDGRSS